jgi:hypothetical protein
MSAIYKYEVKRFEIALAGGKANRAVEGCPAGITLYDSMHTIAQLFFHSDKSTMPEQDTTPDEIDLVNKFVKSHFLIADYPNVLALLSGSRPVYCGHLRTPPQVWLTTEREHVRALTSDEAA